MLLRKFPCIIMLCVLAQVSAAIAQTAPVAASTPTPAPTPARPAAKADPSSSPSSRSPPPRTSGYQSTNAAEVTRMNPAITDIPMNVTGLNQQFIEDTLTRKTEDVLEYVPGFVSTSNNDSWSVRGFTNANTKFLNGFLQRESNVSRRSAGLSAR